MSDYLSQQKRPSYQRQCYVIYLLRTPSLTGVFYVFWIVVKRKFTRVLVRRGNYIKGGLVESVLPGVTMSQFMIARRTISYIVNSSILCPPLPKGCGAQGISCELSNHHPQIVRTSANTPSIGRSHLSPRGSSTNSSSYAAKNYLDDVALTCPGLLRT